jgi:glucose-6-phosphate 1-dehydrogenase
MLKKHNYVDGKSRIVVEKPFGKDTESCEDMMGKITADWKEDEIYRIDHYLYAFSRPSPSRSVLAVLPFSR